MPHPVLTPALEAAASGRDLDQEQARRVLDVIMSGGASHVEIAGLLVALRVKGETASEIAGLAQAMRDHAAPVRPAAPDLVDVVGTGGGTPTFNVSTTAALITAAAGCTVAKHGNRSATSRSGAADVLEALGAAIDLTPEQVATCIDEVGFGFLFAPVHHAATRFVIPVRRDLAVRTVFNVLGPLTNPAGARRQLVGVGYPGLQAEIAEALRLLGTEHALVVCSEDGLDEMSTSAPTRVLDVRPDGVRPATVTPADLGLPLGRPEDVVGGSPEENAEITRRVLHGEEGPRADLALANAGAAIHVAGRAESLAEGVAVAREAVASGAAEAVLRRFVARTRELAPAGAPG